ncbi:hypothetical protein RQN30_02390 [Arcanobacterium hippocoleae]
MNESEINPQNLKNSMQQDPEISMQQDLETSVQLDELVESGKTKSGLSAEDQERLRKAQKRNLIIAVVLGILLATLGYFAGANMRAQKQESHASQIILVHCAEYAITENNINYWK